MSKVALTADVMFDDHTKQDAINAALTAIARDLNIDKGKKKRELIFKISFTPLDDLTHVKTGWDVETKLPNQKYEREDINAMTVAAGPDGRGQALYTDSVAEPEGLTYEDVAPEKPTKQFTDDIPSIIN
jgi:hypothetical protein